jgi:hypothetical protein
MFMNYMDYVDDDTMLMFTKGQLERMNATLADPRASLASSSGLTPVPTPRLDTSGADARARSAARDERGTTPTLEFDGVSWVPADQLS